MRELVEIFCEKKHETPSAILINEGDNDIWIPKSQISNIEEGKGDYITIEIPEWLANKNGLI